MKIIELTQGKVTVVDDDVYEWASKFKWYAQKQRNTFYANRHSSQKLGKRYTIQLHREILKLSDTVYGDHRDGDGLNNLRENLRAATTQQNGIGHRSLRENKTSKFRGVSIDKKSKKWRVSLGRHGSLGRFDDEETAARAYDAAAFAKFGEYAQLNFPDA